MCIYLSLVYYDIAPKLDVQNWLFFIRSSHLSSFLTC